MRSKFFRIALLLFILLVYTGLLLAQEIIEEPTKRIDKQRINRLAFSPDSKLLAVAGDEGVWLYNTDNFREAGIFKGRDGDTMCAAFSPNGKILASGEWGKAICLWNVSMHKQIATIDKHRDVVFGIVFTPDGNKIVTTSTDHTIRVWDTIDQKEISKLELIVEWAYSIAISPDGKTLAIGTNMTNVQLWDMETEKKTWEYQNEGAIPYNVAFSPDGKMLAWVGQTKICLMDMKSKNINEILKPISSDALSFSPDGAFLAITSAVDKTIRIWDIEKWKEARKLTGFKDIGWGGEYVVFSPDGMWLGYNGDGGTALFWKSDLPIKPKISVEPKDKLPTNWGRLKHNIF